MVAFCFTYGLSPESCLPPLVNQEVELSTNTLFNCKGTRETVPRNCFQTLFSPAHLFTLYSWPLLYRLPIQAGLAASQVRKSFALHSSRLQEDEVQTSNGGS